MDGSTPTHILLAKIQLTGIKLLSLVGIFGCIFGCIFDMRYRKSWRVGNEGWIWAESHSQNVQNYSQNSKKQHRKKASDLKFGTHVSTTKSQGSARHISSLNLVLWSLKFSKCSPYLTAEIEDEHVDRYSKEAPCILQILTKHFLLKWCNFAMS